MLKMLFEVLSEGSQQQWSEEFRADGSSDKDVCKWHGVTCEDGHVVGISFPGLML